MLSLKKIILGLKRVEPVKKFAHIFSLMMGILAYYNLESIRAGFIGYLLTILAFMFLIHTGEIDELKKSNQRYLDMIAELTKDADS